MSRCLVIGANGFIGSYLVDALAAAGHTVAAFDRFSSGIASYAAADVRPIVGDFLNSDDLRKALIGQDFVFHFLSTTSPAIAEDEPTLDIRTNVSQSVELFRMCVASGVKKVFFASTGGAIYGNQPVDLLSEMSPTLPVSPYAISKLTLENYLRYYRVKHGLDYVSLRISNPYGPRQHPQRKQGLIPIALRHIAEEESVTQFGSGSMTRDYIFVEDLARMIALMPGTRSASQVYNLGSGIGKTVTQVLDTIREVTQRDFAIREIATPTTYLERSVLDTSLFTSEYDVGELFTLSEGVRKTWLAELGARDTAGNQFGKLTQATP